MHLSEWELRGMMLILAAAITVFINIIKHVNKKQRKRIQEIIKQKNKGD